MKNCTGELGQPLETSRIYTEPLQITDRNGDVLYYQKAYSWPSHPQLLPGFESVGLACTVINFGGLAWPVGHSPDCGPAWPIGNTVRYEPRIRRSRIFTEPCEALLMREETVLECIRKRRHYILSPPPSRRFVPWRRLD